MKQIYLDYNASAPIAPRVAAAMRPFLEESWGNPSSLHWAGVPARRAVEKARGQVADLLGCSPEEIVFTSGGTESNNLAIQGTFFAKGGEGSHCVTSAVEHPSVMRTFRFLERQGARLTVVPVDRHGTVDPAAIDSAITQETILVSVMHANNEVGTIQPIREIGEICRRRGVWFHVDAAQSAGKIPTRVDQLGIDLLTVAGHKLYAPKGVGALYVRRGVDLAPLLHGAGHERGLRSGTENVLLLVGLGEACALAAEHADPSPVRELRDHFENALVTRYGDRIRVNGHPTERLPNTLSVNFVGRIGGEVLARLEGVAASTGAACHSGSVELSAVLEAMQVPPEVGMGAIRFSLGRETTREEIDWVLQRIAETVD
jgi:cysteine desulfurase